MDPRKVLAGKSGDPHLSYSSIAKFRAAPNVWALSYLMGIRDDAGPSAWRGQSVEAGLDKLLWGYDLPMALAETRRRWDELAQGVVDEKAAKEYESLEDFLKQAQAATKGKPMPLTRQSKIEVDIPGIDIPLIGYTDYRWDDHGLDLKTTLRMPSEARPDHCEQCTIYRRATGIPFSLLYVTPKKWSIHEVVDDGSAWESVCRSAHALVHAIRKADSPADFMRMFAPDFSVFYWSDPLREAANKFYLETAA
jgi:hypothetical protein